MQIIPVHIEKEIEPSDDISGLVLESSKLSDGDILAVAQKAVSKQEGRTIDLSSVRPSPLSRGIGSQYQKDPRLVELILSETRRIVRMENGIIISETRDGLVCANAGVDQSNVKGGHATLLPADPDLSARTIRKGIMEKSGMNVAVIISDTFGRPFRTGQTNCAIGVSGLEPLLDYAGTRDTFERLLRVTEIAVADELSAAAELVMGKSQNSPAAIIRGYPFRPAAGTAGSLIRPERENLFR